MLGDGSVVFRRLEGVEFRHCGETCHLCRMFPKYNLIMYYCFS